MNALIIDISDTFLRAALSNDGVLEYCRTFDFRPISPSESDVLHSKEPVRKHSTAADNPYLIYYDTDKKNPWDLALKQIINQIRTDIKDSIDSTHLIIPSNEVIMETHLLPKMARPDALKLIGRKIKTETKEGFPPFSIIPGASDHKTQAWSSIYIPTATLQDYHKAFSACQMRLSSITTPVNAMIDAFRSVRETIFNSHAIFEIQGGFIEAFYLSADGLLYFERLGYVSTDTTEIFDNEEREKTQKLKIFKILNAIFSINTNYLLAHPHIPVQKAWVCGIESGLNDVVEALTDAMEIEVDIVVASLIGLSSESGYVPLAGFAESLHNNNATTYSAADFFQRFPLRKTSGYIIYALTASATLITIALTEIEYRTLLKQAKAKQVQQATDSKQGKNRTPAVAYTKNLEVLKALTSRQFVFYNLFRELAKDLPDEVYLENLEFHLKDDKASLNIIALTRLDDKTTENTPFTKLMSMLDSSPTLKNHREAGITVIAKDNDRFFKISIVSEVNPFDSTK